MVLISRFFVFPLVFSIFFLFLGTANSGESYVNIVDNSSRLFEFQKKLAKKGNVAAQYSLGFMYERGIGSGQDIEQAKIWYKQSADKGSEYSANRLTYLQIEENGFESALHNEWLSGIETKASARNPESIFLLAQMYSHGYGVQRNLSKSLSMMYKLSANGLVAAEVEIVAIESKQMELDKKKRAMGNHNKPVTEPKRLSAKVAATETDEAVNKEVKVVMAAQLASQLELEKVKAELKLKKVKEEKRKRYKAVMKQLAAEQAEIDDLQKWAGGTVASVDDEF